MNNRSLRSGFDRDRENLRRDVAKIGSDFSKAIDEVLTQTISTAARELVASAAPDPCEICGENLRGWSEPDQWAHWRAHPWWRRAWNWITYAWLDFWWWFR